MCRVERALELRRPDRLQPIRTVDRLRELREVGVIAIHHLELELLEPLDHVAPNDDIDLVERDLDQRPGAAVLPLAAQLTDGHDLDQRRVTGQLQHQRPRR